MYVHADKPAVYQKLHTQTHIKTGNNTSVREYHINLTI